MDKTLENIVAMIKGCPGGVPGRKVAEQYNRTYHCNLTVSALGFRSMAQLLASQDQLVVQGDLVFHRSHRPPGGSGAPPDAGERDHQSPAPEAGERAAAVAASAPGDGQPAKTRKKRNRSGRGASPGPPAGQPLEVVGSGLGAAALPESSSSGAVPSVGVSPAPQSVPANATHKPGETLTQDQLLQRVTQVGCVTRREAGTLLVL